MSAYLIFTREKTLDRKELEIYWNTIKPTFEGYTVKILANYGKHIDLEGQATEGTVIAEFASMEAAKAWYDSPAYRTVREHRFKGAIYRGMLVQGV